MKRTARIVPIVVLCIAMLILILDSKTALQGAREGLELCAYTVIPSLFPFFVISILLTDALSGHSFFIFQPLRKLCKMPKGSESLIIVGLLGGYPVGAKCIYDSWKCGRITKEDAHRCLGFCNNAGPAFVFGMCGALFSSFEVVLTLWLIHILSALLVGAILPGKETSETYRINPEKISLTEAMTKAIASMVNVCGWVTCFRVIIGFAKRWFLWLLSPYWSVVFEGILELSNGCCALMAVENEGCRFVLCALFLSLGGSCVALQTASAVGELGTGMYFPGKAIQSAISCYMATVFAMIKYRLCSPAIPLSLMLVFVLVIWLVKKTVAFPGRLVYNVEKDCKGGFLCYSGKRLQNPAAIVPVEPK